MNVLYDDVINLEDLGENPEGEGKNF